MQVIVRNDNEALELLEQIIQGADIGFDEVKFEGWPVFKLNVKGERYHSTITPELMRAFLDLQTAINKAYALARYSASSRNLKDAERDDLKILVKVEEGSSEFIAKLLDQIDKIGDALMQMDSKDKLRAVLGIGLFVVGAYAWDSYLDNKVALREKDIAAIELEAERNSRLDTLKLMERMDDNESKRLQLVLGQVVEKHPEVASMRGYVGDAYDKILSGASDAESITVQGRKVPGEVVYELSTTKRQASVGDVVTGVYLILGVDHSVKEFYKFKLRDVIRGQEFAATLPKDGEFVTDQILDILQDAEWGNKVVLLKILTKNNHGKIISAQIEKVTPILDQENFAVAQVPVAKDEPPKLK